MKPPRFWWLMLPFLYFASRIVLIDVSHIEFVNWSASNTCFVNWLNARGLGRRVIFVDPVEHSALAWRANISSVKGALNQVRFMRADKGAATYYLGGYLAHRMQASLARTEYLRLLSAVWGVNVTATSEVDSLRPIVLRLLAIGLTSLLTLLLPLTLIVAAYCSVRLVLRSKVKLHGGICVDLCHGVGDEKKVSIKANGRLTDTFLAEAEGPFYLANHIFLGFGWRLPAMADWRLLLEGEGATLVGPNSGRTPLTPLELLAIVFRNVKCWNYLAWNDVGPVGGWYPQARWNHFKYHLDLFSAQLSFHVAIPGAYLSRLDYSHRHHALGAECKRLGIHFAGICHSPLGGMAYTPNNAIVSFDTYFIYKAVFSERFYPSWLESRAHLSAIGVWRSDFTRQAEAMPDHAAVVADMRFKLGGRYVIGIHLPVPNSHLFDRATTEKWMAWLAEIVHRNREIAFILFPRRFHQSPCYFRNLVNNMLELGRCQIAEVLNPAWAQPYSWLSVCDFVVGCTYSDAVLEALACGIPSVSYADIGQGIAELENFDSTLSVYNGKDLEQVIIMAREGRWPSQELWRRLHANLVGEADGHCIDRIRATLLPHLNLPRRSTLHADY